MSNCGDDVGALVLLALLLSEAAALLPFLIWWRRGDAAFGCAPSALLGFVALLVILAEPIYIDSFRAWLACGSPTRELVIVGVGPALTFVGGLVLLLLARRD